MGFLILVLAQLMTALREAFDGAGLSYEKKVYGKSNNRMDIIFVHIPKTAGMSFRFLINKEGDFDVDHTELCFKALYRDYKQQKPKEVPFSSTFFRAPRAHVLSQFLECKYDTWGKKMTVGTGFPRSNSDSSDFEEWVDHFYDSWNKKDDSKSRKINLDCFHCYHPYNMQIRAMSDECVKVHYLDKSQNPFDTIEESIHNMNSLTFVG